MLSEEFKEWIDTDVSMFILAQCLGLRPDARSEDDRHKQYRESKWVWWSNNIYNQELWNMLMSLAKMGFLEMVEG